MRTIIHEILPAVPANVRAENEALFGRFGLLLLRKHSLVYSTGFALGAIVISTLLRVAIEGSLPPGFPFLTFFPAVLVTLIFAGVQAGAIVSVICGLIAWRFFLPPGDAFHFDRGSLIAMAFYAGITAAEVFFVASTVAALRVLDETKRRASDLARSRELMFTELQHRVSNNLATVAALLRMQSTRSLDPDTKKALSEATQRISTVSRLQRSLHSPDMQDVLADDFLRVLTTETLEASHIDTRPDVNISVEPLTLTRDQAVPLGLITSEMVMNALEHGMPEQGKAMLRLSLVRKEDGDARRAVLEVQDNGKGLPDDFSLETAPSLGLSIARQFAQQLGGEMTMQNGPQGGTLSRLEFPL